MYSYIEKATKNLTLDELSQFSTQFRKKGKSEKVAFVCWLCGGVFGLHRFYTGNYGTAIGLTVITIATYGFGAFAGLYDIVNLRRLVRDANKEVVLSIVKDVKRK